MSEVQDYVQDVPTYDMTNSENMNVQVAILDTPQTPIFDLTNPSHTYPFGEEKITPFINQADPPSSPSTTSDEGISSTEEPPGTPPDSANNGLLDLPTDENGITTLQEVDFKSMNFPPHLTAIIESLRGDPQTQIIIVPVIIPHPLSLRQPQSGGNAQIARSTQVAATKRETEENDPGRTLWNCAECNMVFKSKFSLTRHRKTHTKEKPFKCAFCPKAFAEKSSRKRHVQTHSGARPWKCDLCGKCFADKVNLKRHVEKAHETSE